MAYGTKQLVEAALYGAGDRRRFTLDSPVLSDVWSRFFEAPDARPSLLLEPWLDTPAFTLAEAMMSLRRVNQEKAQISYNRTVVVADLSLHELVEEVLPLTGWYREATSQPITHKVVHAPDLPQAAQMWEDLSLVDTRLRDRAWTQEPGSSRPYPHPRLLGMVRIIGLIGYLQNRSIRAQTETRKLLATLIAGGTAAADDARALLARRVMIGWREAKLSLPEPGRKIIYAVNRNRPAKLAIHQSIRTVKADAASSLFSIDCSTLTWAIIDSGIDRLHPAFARRSADANLPVEKRSRVSETYDFAYLRELLTATNWDDLPEALRTAVSSEQRTFDSNEQTRLRRELALRIRRAKLIDWEAIKPFIRVPHDAGYARPIDPHGTHVAGILGADWDRDQTERMTGMCPTINLIDMRVCRQDGSSDEFVIMSALQFIRHLNSNSDRMAVHGINISLSLEHDAAVYACGRTPVCEEAERTIASGVVVVAAAGNHGYRRILSEDSQPFDQYCPVSITDPGNAKNVITVGSTHRLEPHSYGVSYFSSRGPTGDGRMKPDLVAPGEKIFAPALQDDALRLDGTSMAAPHVSGAAAMLMARHVELTGDPQRIKHILCATATDLGREPYFQGRGLVDVLRAIQSV